MRLSLITVNYNGSANTIKLLKSLQHQTDQDFQVIIVDNASDEADFNKLKDGIGATFLIRNDKNLGFSGGNNVGIQEALKNDSNWVVLLNNDTRVKSNFVAFIKAIVAQKEGIIGLAIDESGGMMAYAGKLEWLKPTLSHIYTINYLPHTTDYYAIGAAMAVHKDVFEKIGFMDEKYFLYFEDADFSIRARRAGIPISITHGFMIYHKASSTTKNLGSPLLLRYHYRNALYFNLKNGPWYIKILVWPWSWWVIVKQVLKIMIYHNRDQSSAILSGVLDFYRNKMGQIVKVAD